MMARKQSFGSIRKLLSGNCRARFTEMSTVSNYQGKAVFGYEKGWDSRHYEESHPFLRKLLGLVSG